METYKQVRAIQRGLDVLRALNALGNSTIAPLSGHTGIHRTTLYRILETLETLGYVRRSATDDSYRLTGQVRRLSEGYDEGEVLAHAASDSLNALLGQIAWPSSVATPRLDAMVIRETTHGRAELFVHATAVGTRSPILTTAMGRSYLAFCEDGEREAIVERVALSQSPQARLARDPGYVKRIVASTREAGYGFSFGETEPALGSIALPVRSAGRIVGGVNVVFLNAFVGRPSAIKNFVPALSSAVSVIERNLAQRQAH